MNNDVENIKRKTFYGGIWKFMERFLAQVITFVVSLILARMLSPTEYGIMAIVTMMINLMNVFVTSGYGAALIQKKDAGDLDFNTMFTFSGMLSVALYFVLFFLAPYISRLYNEQSLVTLIRVMGLRLPIASFNAIQQAYVAKKMEYRKFFWATLGGTIASSVVGIVMALTGCGIWALVGQYFTNVIIDSIVLYCIFPWRYKPFFSIKMARPMIQFGSSVLLASFVDALYQELRTFVVGARYSAENLAFYNRGEQFPKLFALNMGTVIDGTLLPAFSHFQDDLPRLRQGVKRSLQISTLIISPIMFGMATIAEPMVRILLTDKWLDAVPYVQIFCVMYALNPLVSTFNQTIKSMGAGGLYLKAEITKKVGFTLLLLIAMPFGTLAIASSSVVSMLLACVINSFTVRKLIGLSLTDQIMACVPQYGGAILMAVTIWLLKGLINNIGWQLIVQILAGVVVYVVGMLVSQNKATKYLLCMLKDIIGVRK